MAALAFVPGAAAQNDTIVVVGEDEKQRRRELKDFVRELGVANGERTAARWVDPVCPIATGLAPAHAAIVEARVRTIAGAAGARIGKTHCKPNIVVAFAGDGGALARAIRSRAPARLSEVPVTDRLSLFEGSAPIRWWYSTEARDSSGIAVSSILPPWTAGNSEAGGSVLPMNEDSTVLNQYNPSLVSTRTMRALRAATVLVDANLAEGQTLRSIADYVALVALAEIQLDARPANSILGLFSSPDAPKRMSPRDEAFLNALYRLPLDRRARQQRARLVSDMAKPSRDD
jgi:hypothetical protein